METSFANVSMQAIGELFNVSGTSFKTENKGKILFLDVST